MTFGELIRALLGDEQCYERNRREAERIRAEKGAIVAHYSFLNAEVQKRQRNQCENGIELLCNEKFGACLSSGNALKLRGELCRIHGLTLEQSDALSLDDVVSHFRKGSGHSEAADEPVKIKSQAPGWWATQPPGEGWHDKPLIGTKKELAHCVGIALRKRPVDVKTLPNMHEKSVWIFRVNDITWQAYFHTREILATANLALIELRKGT